MVRRNKSQKRWVTKQAIVQFRPQVCSGPLPRCAVAHTAHATETSTNVDWIDKREDKNSKQRVQRQLAFGTNHISLGFVQCQLVQQKANMLKTLAAAVPMAREVVLRDL
jgi:hypothetical protein